MRDRESSKRPSSKLKRSSKIKSRGMAVLGRLQEDNDGACGVARLDFAVLGFLE
jgi:hypothetical protein